MRRLFIVVIIIFICIFVYFSATSLKGFVNDISMIMSYKYSSTSIPFGFKSTPENLELVNSYLAVNNSFINDLSKDIILDNNIENVYSLVDTFPEFKAYYSVKLKLEKAIFEGLPYLCKENVLDSNTKVTNFFNNNSNYLEKTFGISSPEQFSDFVSCLTLLKDKDFKYAKVIEKSNDYANCSVFSVEVGSSLEDSVCFDVIAYHFNDTKNQKAPVIVFYTSGGVSDD